MLIRCLHLIGPLLLFLLCSGVPAWAAYPGYRITQQSQESYGISAQLALNGAGPYGSDIATPAVSVYYQTSNILRIKVYDPNYPRWEVPDVNQLNPPTSAPANLDYKVELQSNPFGFTVSRVADADVIFNTIDAAFNPLLFSDQYLELSTTLPDSPNIYGLGERITNFRLPLNNNYTIWNIDQGTPTMKNLYGTHPFYMDMRPTGNAHGVFILNSNAQNWELTSNSLTYRTIGGIFDIFVFLGPSPAEVIQQYHSVIGYPHFPPYWGLGWHQCRWGYKNLSETMDVVASYAKYGIPLDTMWNDIDYMDEYRDFSNDPVNYPQPDVRSFVEELHSNGQHYIMIIDPGISIDPGYPSYDQLMEAHAYVRTFNTSTPIQGKVWPGLVYFPDFFHPNATDYWYNQVAAFHGVGPEFDGMWIDMNEISNFCTGQCPDEEKRARQVKATAASLDNPPYLPTNGVVLDHNTVNVTAQQYIGLMYDTHSMYGWSEGVASKLALEKLRGTRSVVISRSTFAGTGHHNGHWLGDNDSTWTSMYESIAGVLSMQLFGINFVGADICGFGGDTTAQLCARWMQLGSLYPFSRNHNSIGQISQEPYAFGEPLISISIFALKTRYSLLSYYYTLFQAAHTNATTVWRPLFFEFPTDANTYGIDEQFMVGPYLLVSPVLVENATTVNAYFPQGVWYCLYEGFAITSSGGYQNISAPLEIIRIHVRGGGIVPTQVPALTTAATRQNDFGLLVALDKSGNAAGTLYLDDGESLDPITQYTYVTFTAIPQGTGGQVTSSVVSSTFQAPPLGSITIYGVQQSPSKVVLQNSPATFSYNATSQVLNINATSTSITTNFVLNWM